MKQLLLLVGALLTLPTYQALAQQPMPGPLSHVQGVTVQQVDSATVLQHLFQQNRRLGLLSLATATGTSSGLNALQDPRGWRQIVGGVTVGADTGLLVVELVERLKFSRKREQETMERLPQHQPLRPYIQRSYTVALIHAATTRR